MSLHAKMMPRSGTSIYPPTPATFKYPNQFIPLMTKIPGEQNQQTQTQNTAYVETHYQQQQPSNDISEEVENSNAGDGSTLQYRIYKRGDRIPGISDPPIMVSDISPPPTRQNHNVISSTAGPASTSTDVNVTSNKKTPTTLVIELAKFNGLKAEYHLLRKEGPPHCPLFTVQLNLGENEKYEAAGLSIKKAQLAAAEQALSMTHLMRPSNPSQARPARPKAGRNQKHHRPQRKSDSYVPNQRAGNEVPSAPTQLAQSEVLPTDKNPISTLYEICMKVNAKVEYIVISEVGPPHQKVFKLRCQVQKDEYFEMTEAEAATKQQAKKLASELMVEKIAAVSSPVFNLNHSNSKAKKPSRRKSNGLRPQIIREVDECEQSPISKLMQIAQERKMKEPVFELVNEDRSSNTSDANQQKKGRKFKYASFTTKVIAGSFIGIGTGPNKKESKKAAAEDVLRQMGFALAKPTSNPGTGTIEAVSAAVVSGSTAPLKAPIPTSSAVEEKEIKFSSGKQVVPGIIVLHKLENDKKSSPPSSSSEESKQIKFTGSPEETEHIDKLTYLSNLLGVHLSFSDFPKRDEFLCVVSLSTTPPHVAHGIGGTMLQARNLASLKVLEELSNTGIDPLQPVN